MDIEHDYIPSKKICIVCKKNKCVDIDFCEKKKTNWEGIQILNKIDYKLKMIIIHRVDRPNRYINCTFNHQESTGGERVNLYFYRICFSLIHILFFYQYTFF